MNDIRIFVFKKLPLMEEVRLTGNLYRVSPAHLTERLPSILKIPTKTYRHLFYFFYTDAIVLFISNCFDALIPKSVHCVALECGGSRK